MSLNLADIVDTVIDSLTEIRLIRKRTNEYKIDVIVLDEKGDGNRYKGLITPDSKALVIHELHRIQPHPIIYNIDGRKTCILPKKSNRIDYKKIYDVACAQQYDVEVKWRHMRRWITTSVTNVTGSIDFNLFDNDFSQDFTADGYLIYHSERLKILASTPNWKLLLIALSACMIGIFIGFIVSSIFDVIFGGILIWLIN